MRINIPNNSGVGQVLQHQLVPEINNLGKAVAGAVHASQQQYAYNNLAEYEDGPDGLKRHESRYHETYWQKQNGSDPDAVARYEAGINKMQQDYVAKVRKESGDMVADIMSKRAELRARKYIEEADRTQAKLFFNRTVEANKLRASQAAKDLAPMFWNNRVIDQAFLAIDQEVETQRGVLGDYADEVKRIKGEIIVEHGLKAALADPNMAPAVLRKLKEDPEYKAKLYERIPVDKVNDIEHAMKAAESYIRAREADEERALRKAEMDAKEELKQQREATGAVFVEKYVAGTLTAREILKSNLEATGENSKKYWIEQIKAQNDKYKKAGDEGFKTDPAVKRDVYVKIINDPESISESDIAGMIGAGLSNADGKQLIDERRRRLEKDPARAAAEKAVIQNLGRDRKAGIFGDGQEGDLEYTRQIEAFKRWSRANPDQEPSEYYENVMKPVREARLFGLIDAVRDPKQRRQELETSGQIPKRKAQVAKPMTEMPPAAAHKDKTIRDTETGKRYKSDGKNWVEVQ